MVKMGAIAETAVAVPSPSTLSYLCCPPPQCWWEPAPPLLVPQAPMGTRVTLGHCL